MCALQWSLMFFYAKAWMTTVIGGCNGGSLDLPPGQNYLSLLINCRFRAKILKNNMKMRLGAAPLQENTVTGYIIQVYQYMFKGFEYEKIPLLISECFEQGIPWQLHFATHWPIILEKVVLFGEPMRIQHKNWKEVHPKEINSVPSHIFLLIIIPFLG